jgi:hypothetical protein
MALVQHLPEGDLGVARDVNVLRAIADKLHQTQNSLADSTQRTICQLQALLPTRMTSCKNSS